MGQHSNGNQLTRVQIGWKGLEDVINEIRNRINVNQPLEGSGIRIEDSPGGGKLISLSPSPTTSSDNQQPQPSNNNLVAVTIQAFDTNNNPVTLTVMVPVSNSGFGPSTLQWQPITVVDPNTCAQSTKPLLGQVSQ